MTRLLVTAQTCAPEIPVGGSAIRLQFFGSFFALAASTPPIQRESAPQISAIKIGDEIMISSTFDLGHIVSGWDPHETWGHILNHVAPL
jgi:hypothetical protein